MLPCFTYSSTLAAVLFVLHADADTDPLVNEHDPILSILRKQDGSKTAPDK